MLAAWSDDLDGAYAFHHREETGAIFLHAWKEDLWVELSRDYFESHMDVLRKLGVSYDIVQTGVLCRFTEAQARAFTLLHVFLHELGHHYDYIHQKHRGSSKGEDYAERFATNRLEELFQKYCAVFGDPSRNQ